MSTEAPPAPPPVVPPPAAPVTPNFSDWRKSDGTINHEAFKALPEDIRYVGDSLTKYKTDVDLFRGIAHLQTLGGKKGLIPLAADAPKEAIAERKSLLDSVNGVPKEAKDYGLKKPDDLPDSAWNPKTVEGAQAWAHKWSISPAALNELVGLNLAGAKEQIAAYADQEKQFLADQQKAFDGQIRQENIPAERANALVDRGAIQLGLNPELPEDQMLLKNAKVRLMAMRNAMATGEDSAGAPNSAVNGGGGDPEKLANDAAHNKANPLHEPLYNPSHPQHKMAKEKVDQWWRQVAASKVKGGAR